MGTFDGKKHDIAKWQIRSILFGILIGLVISYISSAHSEVQNLENEAFMSPKSTISKSKTFGRIEPPPVSSRRLCGRVAVKDLPKLDTSNVWMLKPHRKVSKNIPTTGSWALWLGDAEPGYLGKIGGDGPSEEALKSKSHIRVALPTVPRSGNHWFRDLWEKATGRTTGAVFDSHETFFDGACSIHLKRNAGATPDCKNGEHVLVKSHTPFQAIMHKDYKYDADYSNLSYAINIIRNPFDNHRAWDKFYAPRKIFMQEFSYLWRAHHEFWETSGREGLARYMLRYEDMLIDVEKELRGALDAVPGKKLWTEKTIRAAINYRPASKKFEDKCGESLGDLSHEEMVFMKERFGGTMARYGYFLEYEPN